PGAAPPATANVETRSEVRAIDNFGRVEQFAQLGDVHRDDDDLCVSTTYAEPTGTSERQRHAVASQTVTNCAQGSPVILAKDHWEYDKLSEGHVAAGFPTAHSVERRDDTGARSTTIRQFDATFDDLGNPILVTTQREDGVSRSATAAFDDTDDPFRLGPATITTTATGVPSTQITFTRDPLTRQVLFTTDPNGTQRGVRLDAFDRVVQSIVIPPGGAEGSLSFM